MNGRSVRVYGSELEPPSSARTVRVRGQHAIVTDGPFAETKEQIVDFNVLECADLDEAIEIAVGHPMARLGSLEVRPFWPFEEDYLVFNEGYAASAGDDLIRRDLCDRAAALTQVLAELLPAEPEAKGLLALMLFHRARQAGWSGLA